MWNNKSQMVRAAIAVATLTAASLAAMPAKAVVVCKTVGVPKGCVAAAAAPVVVAPAAPAAVVVAPVVRPVVRPVRRAVIVR